MNLCTKRVTHLATLAKVVIPAPKIEIILAAKKKKTFGEILEAWKISESAAP